MDEEEKKKRKRRKNLKKLHRKLRPRLHLGGSLNRRLRPRITPYNSQRFIKPKDKPKTEKTHWNGKVEPWTEPEKQKIRKIVKHEVDTEKLFKDLETENEKTLNKLAERIEESISNIQQLKVEEKEPEVVAEAKVKSDNIMTSAQTTDEEVANNELLDSDELNIEEILNEPEENIEDESTPMDETTEDFEITEIEDLEPEQTITDEPDSSDFGSELILFNPDFWQEMENDLWGDFEQIEPEAEYAPTEEAVME